MSGSQVFYMGDNGEVVLWDGLTNIANLPYCVTELETQYPQPCPICRAVGCDCSINGRWRGRVCATIADEPAVVVPDDDRYIDYDIGYAQALRDVLAEIVASGKQNLVQWLEARLKDLP